MELTANMSSLSQMPQALTEFSPVVDSANGQPNTLQSMRFFMILNQCAGTGEGVEKFAESFTPGQLSKVIADTAKTVLKSPEQKEPDSGLSDAGKEVKSIQVTEPGTDSFIPQIEHEASPMIGKLLYRDESATNVLEELLADGAGKMQTASEKPSGAKTLQKPLILCAEKSNLLESIQTEVPAESSKEATNSDSAWPLQFAADNSFIQWNAAKQLTESQTKVNVKSSPVSGLQAPAISGEQEAKQAMPGLLTGLLRNNLKQAASQPEKPGEATDVSSMSKAQERIHVKENVSDEKLQNSTANQPNFLIQAAATAATGNVPDLSASFSSETPDATLSSGIQNQVSFLKAAAIYRTISPEIESVPGSSGKISEISMKNGTDVAVSQTDVENRVNKDISISQTQAKKPETATEITQGAGKSFQTAKQVPDIQEIGKVGESVGNRNRSMAVEGIVHGNNEVSTVQPGNVPQSNQAANNDLIAANAGLDPRRIDIVFVEEARAELKEAGGESLQKSRENKTSGNATMIDFVPNSGGLRGHEESRISPPATDSKVPLSEQLTNQIKEKLDANDHVPNNGRITLKLHPEEFGELKINMRMEDQHLKVEITTQNASVKEALMQNLDTLKETLSRQNIAMDHFKVSEDLRQGSQQWSRDGRQAMQDNRGANTGYQPAPAVEVDAIPDLRYRWENEESLVNLTL
jgi:flagellar hook-length control protein FliK